MYEYIFRQQICCNKSWNLIWRTSYVTCLLLVYFIYKPVGTHMHCFYCVYNSPMYVWYIRAYFCYWGFYYWCKIKIKGLEKMIQTDTTVEPIAFFCAIYIDIDFCISNWISHSDCLDYKKYSILLNNFIKALHLLYSVTWKYLAGICIFLK